MVRSLWTFIAYLYPQIFLSHVKEINFSSPLHQHSEKNSFIKYIVHDMPTSQSYIPKLYDISGSERKKNTTQARTKLFEKKGGGVRFCKSGLYTVIGFFLIGPPPASKVAQVMKKLMGGGGGGGGGTPTLFFFLLKNVGSIFQTGGRGIFVHHQPL